MGTTDLTVKLILALRNDPLSSLRDLSAILGPAPNTIRLRLQELKQEGILRDDSTIEDSVLGSRKKTEVVAHVSPEKLGLQRVCVVFESVPDYSSYKNLISYLDKQPYTYFRVKGLSSWLSLYAIFDIPKNGIDYLLDFFQSLCNMGLCRQFDYLMENHSVVSSDDLEGWSANMYTSVTGENQFGLDEGLFSFLKSDHPDILHIHKIAVEKVPQLDETQLSLIRELTINGNPIITELTEYYNKDRSTISRRISDIRQTYIDRYTLLYRRDYFNLDSVFLVRGTLSPQIANSFALFIRDYFPFSSNLRFNDQFQFFWYVYSPTSYLNDVIDVLLNFTDDIQLMLIHSKSNMRYYFYPKNYDITEKDWKISKDYIIQDPLA